MYRAFIATVFPDQCASCGLPGSGLCEGCFSGGGALTFDLTTLRVHALGSYDGALRRAVLALKDGRRDVAAALAALLAARVPAGATLVPVRTTAARRRIRGIDGVEYVARSIAERADVRVCSALACVGADAQRGRSRAQRVEARDRFWCEARLVAGAGVVLVDDVCTTGTTLEDCAGALRRAGARVSQAFVVAAAKREG
jgi:predicted amidophosphoribosyltransferase